MSRAGVPSRWLLPAAASCVFVELLVLGWAVAHGFDFTDESFYVSHVGLLVDDTVSSSFFGPLLHPLWRLTGGSLFAFRLVGVLLLFALAATTAHRLAARAELEGRARLVAALLGAGVAGFYYVNLWLPTPSYNWLAGVLGLILVNGLLSGPRLAPWLIGLAGGLAFLNKPPAAAAMGLFAIVWVLSAPGDWRSRLRLLLSSAAVALGVLGLFFLFEDVESYLDGVRQVLSGSRVRRNPVGQVARSVRPRGVWLWAAAGVALLSAAACGLTWLRPSLRGSRVWLRRALLPLGLVALAVLVAMPAERFDRIAFVFSVSAACVAIALFGRGGLRGPHLERMLPLLCVLPLAFSFGTNNNVVQHAGMYASLPWMVFVVLVLRAISDGEASSIWLALPLLLLVPLATQAVSQPYRAVALWEQRDEVCAVDDSFCVRVETDTADVIRGIRAAAVEAGFRAGDPFVDLSGRMPGLALVLGGRPLGGHWMIGGYAYSRAIARHRLEREPPDVRARAWLLTGDSDYALDDAQFLRDVGFSRAAESRPIWSAQWPRTGDRLTLIAPTQP